MPRYKGIEISILDQCSASADCKHPVEAAVKGPESWLPMCMGHMNIANLQGTVELLKAMVTR